MEHIAPIITAVASLLWASFAFTALFVFRADISRILSRVTKGEILGQKIELSEQLGELQATAAATAIETTELPKDDPPIPTTDRDATLDALIKAILQQAASSPRLALITLSAELEKQARQALATRGLLQGRSNVPVTEALSELHQYGFPPNLAGALRLFLDVRNKIVHGATATDDDAISAIDSGLSILRTLNALPNEVKVVYQTSVDLFMDAECTQRLPDAKGIILETTSPGGAMKGFAIYPTTRMHFKKGERVAWEWNMQKVWPAAWYRDPDTGAVKQAWVKSAEFIGRHLDDI